MSGDPFLDALNARAGAAAAIDPVEAALGAKASQPQATPRAVRNNNPGNLRWDGKSQWQGMTGVDPDGFVRFDSPDNGQRALSINLGNQANLHGLNTVRAIISKYAPSTDGNDTAAYIDTVAKQLGIDPDAHIDPSDPHINAALQAVIKPVEQGGGIAAPTQAPPQAANDPYLAALDAAIRGGNAALPGATVAPAPLGPGSGSGSADPDSGMGLPDTPAKGQAGSTGRFIASLDPAIDSIVNGSNYLRNVQDRVAGMVDGAASVPESLLRLQAWINGGDKTPTGAGAKMVADWMGKHSGDLAHNPSSNNYAVGKFGGEIGATLPLAEVTPLAGAARLSKAGKVGSVLARYGDMSLQGAAAGAATSRGENVGERAAGGAVLAPVLGGAVDTIAPLAVKVADSVAGSRIANAVTDRLAAMDRVREGGSATAPDAAPTADSAASGLSAQGWKANEIAQGWRKGADGQTEFVPGPTIRKGYQGPADDPTNANGGIGPDGKMTVNIYGGAPEQAAAARKPAGPSESAQGSPEVSAYVDAYLAGHGRGTSADDLKLQQFAANHASEIEAEFAKRASSNPDADQPGAEVPQAAGPAVSRIDPAEASQALGSSGARSGVEGITDLPPEVSDTYQQLRKQGVPADQALREADIRAAGAKPTIAAVTRNPEDQAATWEGAKQGTPEGRALSAQIAQNNAAVLGKAQSLIEANGGVPAQGEAAQTAATSLAKASDAERARVTALYKQAREAEGDRTVSVDSLRELLATPEYRAPTDAQSRELISGMNTLIKAMTAQNRGRFTPDQVESLRQAANAAYDRMGGSVNGKIGAIKGALDESLDQLQKAGPAYKTARLAHKDWAAAYESPEGVSRLIQRDAQGNFRNADNWRSAEGFVSSTGDKQFVQVARQLHALGDEHAISRLKASILQRAYESATNSATDRLGNSTMSAKRYFDTLNRIGTTKLRAIFSPHEMAQIASLGRAAQALNEAVPGTVNSSNTASALAKALMGSQPSGKVKAVRTAARISGHIVGATTGHLGGNVAVEGVHVAAKAIGERSSAVKLAAALRETMDPAVARAAENARAQRMADALRRHAFAHAAAQKTSPVTGALVGHRERYGFR